jgi:hypothetical protein
MSALRFLCLALATLGAAGALAACGTSSGDAVQAAAKPTSRADWATQANVICVKKSQELSALNADLTATMGDIGFEAFLRNILAVEEQSLMDLRNLPVPPADKSAIDQLLELQAEANGAYSRAIPELATDPAEGFELLASSNDLSLRSGGMARELGAAACDETIPLDEFIAEDEDGSSHLLSDDFSDRQSSMWEPSRNRGTAAGIEHGAYRLSVTGRDEVAGSTGLFSDTADRVALSADVELLRSSHAPEFAAVGCIAGSGRGGGYNFVVGPDVSYYAITKVSSHGVRLLAQGQRAEVVRGVGERNRVRGECVSDGPGGATILRLSVNGKRVLETRDRKGFGDFVGVGLIVWSDAGGTSVAFDDVVADAL